MKIELTKLTQDQMVRSLAALRNILRKSDQYATGKKVDYSVMLSLRLAPDQFPFVRQVQIACDNAKMCVARLTGLEAPKHPDTESTLEELLNRIDSTIEFIRSVDPAKFNGFEKREIRFHWNPGKWMDGHTYLYQHALPNFYFHMTTAYSILRANGVELGKGDYLGEQNWQS